MYPSSDPFRVEILDGDPLRLTQAVAAVFGLRVISRDPIEVVKDDVCPRRQRDADAVIRIARSLSVRSSRWLRIKTPRLRSHGRITGVATRVREKIAELERSGELAGLIEKAAAEAVDEPEDDNDTQGETAT